MSKQNPLNRQDKITKRVEPELETDSIGEAEGNTSAVMVCESYTQGKSDMADWITDREKDQLMYEAAKPTDIETDLDKETWQADRNLGLTPSICDSYQATLLQTCWTPDTLNMVATEITDVDRKEQSGKFTKWMVGRQECDCRPEVDDFIHNRIVAGTSIFKVRWKVWYEWVDRRMPKEKKIEGQKNEFFGYDIKTEEMRFERGVLENIDDLDDLVYPTFGKTLQSKAFLIHVLHKSAQDVIDEAERGYYQGVDEKFVKKLKQAICTSLLGKDKKKYLGLTETNLSASDLMSFSVDLYEWYGKHKKNGKFEEYRITVDPLTKTTLAMKPLRKITRSGKRPFAGGGLIRRPGLFNGKSLPRLLAPVSNAFNNVFNQKSDFQYTQNCPFGVYKPDENFSEQNYKIRPGDLFPSDNPNDWNFPNLTRSLAWADSDFNLLLQMAERLTGAASYFMTNDRGVSGTATRDKIIEQKSETRFGLWVQRIQEDISEAITMLFEYYQDWAPNDLGERVLGKDGKKLFPNFSIETLRGNYDVNLWPDVSGGSKTLERQIALWGLESLQNTVWFNPQINPRGNWHIVNDAAKKVGIHNIDNIMPPEPRVDFGTMKVVEEKWTRIKQGEVLSLEPDEDVMSLFMGLTEKKDKEYFELDKEYRKNFDNYVFSLYVAMIEKINQLNQEQQSSNMAMQMIMNEKKGIKMTEGMIPTGQPNSQPNVAPNTSPLPGI